MALIRTARISISPCSLADAPDFAALERDPEVMRYLTGGQVGNGVPEELAGTYLQPRGREDHVWTARHAESGSFVGWFCLWPETAQRAEIGYRLCRAAWGQGLASEGAAALMNWGFESAGHDTIVASTMAANHASRRVLEKIGMRLVRIDPASWADLIPGGEQGEAHYACNRPRA